MGALCAKFHSDEREKFTLCPETVYNTTANTETITFSFKIIAVVPPGTFHSILLFQYTEDFSPRHTRRAQPKTAKMGEGWLN